jgi:hypothetical protein
MSRPIPANEFSTWSKRWVSMRPGRPAEVADGRTGQSALPCAITMEEDA